MTLQSSTKLVFGEAFFGRVKDERGRIDILVNNAWGGYEIMVDQKPFRDSTGNSGHIESSSSADATVSLHQG